MLLIYQLGFFSNYSCYLHLATDANRIVASESQFSLVIDFESLVIRPTQRMMKTSHKIEAPFSSE